MISIPNFDGLCAIREFEKPELEETDFTNVGDRARTESAGFELLRDWRSRNGLARV